MYCWTNLLNGKRYIGSSVNLTNRFYVYFNVKALDRCLVRSKSQIYQALVKYGYANFSLDILEYCDSANVIEREQYWLDTLKPEYNILNLASSIAAWSSAPRVIRPMALRA